MSGTELIMGMEEVINYLKDLEAENKKLKEELQLIKDEAKFFSKVFKNIEEENKKLKFDIEKLNDIAEERGSHMEALEEERVRLQSQNKQLQEEQLTEENAIRYVYENTDEYDDWVYGSTLYQELVEKNKKLQFDYDTRGDIVKGLNATLQQLEEDEEMMLSAVEAMKFMGNKWDEEKKEWVDKESESEEEEEKSKYDGDDWAYGYGFIVKDGEYRISMAGGGAHWTDYVMNKNGCFIHNKDGMKKVRTFISCPEGNLIKVYNYESVLEGGIELDEGETDMYEMVKECYEEEIMNYPDEEYEEPDSP